MQTAGKQEIAVQEKPLDARPRRQEVQESALHDNHRYMLLVVSTNQDFSAGVSFLVVVESSGRLEGKHLFGATETGARLQGIEIDATACVAQVIELGRLRHWWVASSSSCTKRT